VTFWRWRATVTDVTADPATSYRRRAVSLVSVGVAGLVCWLSAASGWVSWAALLGWVAARAAWIASLLVLFALIGAGGWIWARQGRLQISRPRVVLSWWVVAGALFVVVVVSWVATGWLLHEAAFAKDVAATRVDAIKTGLSIGAGTGGVFALLLAVRRQWHQELSAADTALDATERRVTELYTKAVEQLGSEKAPVRLGGLYALERLAQANPTQRQTVVNVFCAYLRMPYQPPEAATDIEDGSPEAPVPVDDASVPSGPATAEFRRTEFEQQRVQEREVRVTAERILTSHLQPGADPARPTTTFWPDSLIDLTGAYLTYFNLRRCHLRAATFEKAQFSRQASFEGARFDRDAVFIRAQFDHGAVFAGVQVRGVAWFGETQFKDATWFSEATFVGDARFGEATFVGDAWFGDATFAGDARFDEATFAGNTQFGDATFVGDAWFGDATFAGDARFGDATFAGDAYFDEATFAGNTQFGDATFICETRFDGARFSDATAVSDDPPAGTKWSPDDGTGWREVIPTDDDDAEGSTAALPSPPALADPVT
jgi:uncharacterized protein YjbI with pentapeptide repeats